MINLVNIADAYRLSYSQGGKAGAVQKCVTCRGRGMRVMIRQLAPGMVQQMQSVCTDCNGEGNMSSTHRAFSITSTGTLVKYPTSLCFVFVLVQVR